jgi:ribosome maturation factor RimP
MKKSFRGIPWGCKMQKNDTIEKVRRIVHNILQDNGIELIDITCRRESGGNVLRVSADTENGITVGECARMNGLISEALDALNLIEDRYILEISSPGLDRPLKTKADFVRYKGKKVRVHTYAPIEGKKEFIGILQEVDDEKISMLEAGGVEVSIDLDKMSSARLDF